ncbi:MAG: hypothetical protein ACI9OJ_005042 [Myxococcota bacterium]|jgi:hypothetical protein
MIFFGEDSLKLAATELGSPYNKQRPHQEIGNERISRRAIVGEETSSAPSG